MLIHKIPGKFIFKIISFIFLFTGCMNNSELSDEAPLTKTPVTITKISIEPLVETIELNAVSVFPKKNIIKSVITGKIENIEINPGDKVEKEQTLFIIKTKEATALDKNFQADSNFNFKGLIYIRAPKSGIISQIAHQKGDYVQEGDELAELSEQKSLIFLLEVPFELRNYIIPNSKCEILLPDNRIIQGIIGTDMPAMDIQSQVVNFVIKPAGAENLPENLIAKVRIIKNSNKRAFVLPKQAILSDETQTEFWVMKLVNDSTAIKIPVRTGIENADKIEILEPNFVSSDRIILNGNYGLPDTALIEIVKK